MKIELKLLGGMLGSRPDFKARSAIDVDFTGNTIGDLLNHFLSTIPLEEKILFLDERGEFQPELLVFRNGAFIPAPDRFSQPLVEDDLVELGMLSG